MGAATAANGMKLGAMLTLGPLGLVGGVQACKMYRNWTASEEDNLRAHDAGATRKESVAKRMTAGANGPVAHFNAQYLEKQLKTNSALRDHADDVRMAHAQATGLKTPSTSSNTKTPQGTSAKDSIAKLKAPSAK